MRYTIILFISIILLPIIPKSYRKREGEPLSFAGFWRPQMPPRPPPHTPPYLTVLMTEKGRGAIIFAGFWRPLMPPSPDVTILNDLNDRERGAIIFCRILAPPMPPPSPEATILNYLNDREGGGHYLL